MKLGFGTLVPFLGHLFGRTRPALTFHYYCLSTLFFLLGHMGHIYIKEKEKKKKNKRYKNTIGKLGACVPVPASQREVVAP